MPHRGEAIDAAVSSGVCSLTAQRVGITSDKVRREDPTEEPPTQPQFNNSPIPQLNNPYSSPTTCNFANFRCSFR